MAKTPIDLEDDDIETPVVDMDEDEPSSASSTTKSKKVVEDDDDADFSNTDDYHRSGDLDLLKADKEGRFVRFSILAHPETGKALAKKSFAHYEQGKGFAVCLSEHDKKGNITKPAFCCAKKDSDRRVVCLVVDYISIDTKTGAFLKDRPVEFEIKALGLSTTAFKAIGMLALVTEEDSDAVSTLKVTDLDIVGTPEGKNKGTKYARKTKKPSYTKDPKLMEAVMEAAKPFFDGRALRQKCGKVMTATEMRVHLGVATASGDEDEDMSDL